MYHVVRLLSGAALLSLCAGLAQAGSVTSPVVYSTGVSVEYRAVSSNGSLVGKLTATGKTISATPSGGSAQAFGTAGRGHFEMVALFDLTTGNLLDNGHSLKVTKKVAGVHETLYQSTGIYNLTSRFWAPATTGEAAGQSSFTFDWRRDANAGTLVQGTSYAHIMVDIGTGGFLKDLNGTTSGFSFGGWGSAAANAVLFKNGYAVNGGLPSSALGTSNVYAVPVPVAVWGGGAALAALAGLKAFKRKGA